MFVCVGRTQNLKGLKDMRAPSVQMIPRTKIPTSARKSGCEGGGSMRELQALVAPNPPQGALVRGHAGLVINKLPFLGSAVRHCLREAMPFVEKGSYVL